MKQIVMFGAGQDSTAMIIEMYKRKMPIEEVIFADTGTEMPETYEFLKVFSKWLKKRNIPLIIVKSQHGCLYDYYYKKKIFPSRMYRHCTDRFKIQPIRRYLTKKYGRKRKNQSYPYIRLFGIASDEKHRADKIRYSNEDVSFPLLDFNFNRKKCIETIKRAGLPVPVKSGCYICPFQSKRVWRELLDKHPELFKKAREIEENAKCYPEILLGQKPLKQINKWKDQTKLYENQRCIYCEIIK